MSTVRKYRSWALIAVVLLLFGTAVASSQYKVPVIMTGIMEQFNMDGGSASWLMSIFTFVGIVLAIPVGGLAKKFGPKVLLLVAGGAAVWLTNSRTDDRHEDYVAYIYGERTTDRAVVMAEMQKTMTAMATDGSDSVEEQLKSMFSN